MGVARAAQGNAVAATGPREVAAGGRAIGERGEPETIDAEGAITPLWE